MKKLLSAMLCLLLVLSGCSKTAENSNETNNPTNYTPQEIVDKLYVGLDDMPMLGTTELDKDNIAYFLGTDQIDFKSGIASEPMMSSIAWSVVVVELNDGADVNQTKQLILDNVDPRKWICVEAESVKCYCVGNTVVLVMVSNDYAGQIEENFNNL